MNVSLSSLMYVKVAKMKKLKNSILFSAQFSAFYFCVEDFFLAKV